jgi:hypothetical protein
MGQNAIWLVILLLFVLAIGMEFNGLYGQDSHVYLAYSKSMREQLLNGVNPGSFFWPKGYPLAGMLLSLTGMPELWALRIVSLFSLVGTLWLANKLIRLLYDKDGSLLLLLGAVTQIYFVRSGFLVMSDMLAAFCVTGVFYTYFMILLSKKKSAFIGLCLFAVAAFFTRYATGPILVIPVIHGTILFLRKIPLFWRLTLLVSGVFLSGLLVWFNNRIISEALFQFSDWSFANGFRLAFDSRDGITHNTVPNLLYVFGNFLHIGYFSMGILLIPYYRKMNGNSLLILACVGLYLFFLFGIQMQNYRFLVISHQPVLVALFPAFDGFRLWLGGKATLFAIGVLLFNGVFAWYSFRKTYKVHCVEREIVSELRPFLKNETVYAFYVDQSFPSYGIQNRVQNFFMKDYSHFEHGAVVVFNEAQFSHQWQNQRVMRNWRRLTENYQLDTLKVLTDNWSIYRIR